MYGLVIQSYLPPMEGWHVANSFKHFSGGLHIPIMHRLIFQQRPNGMSHLHRDVQCPDWWQSMCTMKWGTSCSENYCGCWGVSDLEWDVRNESQLAKVGLIEIQACHAGLDCRSQLCLNINHRPEHTQQSKAQLHHEYPSSGLASDALGCPFEMCPNDYDIPAQGAALPPLCEPKSYILTLGLNCRVDCVDCWMELAITQWRSWQYMPRTLLGTQTLIVCQQ
jgi:hypothetical protein